MITTVLQAFNSINRKGQDSVGYLALSCPVALREILTCLVDSIKTPGIRSGAKKCRILFIIASSHGGRKARPGSGQTLRKSIKMDIIQGSLSCNSHTTYVHPANISSHEPEANISENGEVYRCLLDVHVYRDTDSGTCVESATLIF